MQALCAGSECGVRGGPGAGAAAVSVTSCDPQPALVTDARHATQHTAQKHHATKQTSCRLLNISLNFGEFLVLLGVGRLCCHCVVAACGTRCGQLSTSRG